MSFADDLRKAEKSAKALMEQQSKVKKAPRKRVSTSGGTSKKAVSNFTIEDDIIAFYLQISPPSKFLKENYSKKRNVSVRSMEIHMAGFLCLIKGKRSDDITDQMRSVFKEYCDVDSKDVQKVVISILRGENNPMTLEASSDQLSSNGDVAVVKRNP